MCGIVGFSGLGDLDLLRKMNDSLVHRGPDDKGEFIDKQMQVGIAMRRLSIIDLACGRQPMSNEDESIWVVFNGEIYNFASLRRELINKGHKFKSHHCDTEVLVHLYEEKGPQMLHDLNGMFAFVIYDRKKNILFGSRDRMGIKPLYYIEKNGKFLFASEIKALLSFDQVSKDIDFESLYDYMSFQFIPAPNCIFKDIKKIPCAHYFIFNIKSKQLTIKRYWDVLGVKTIKMGVGEAVDLIRQETKRAVLDWSMSDVGIACSLSGGIDSSSVLGLLSNSGLRDIKTFSLGFKNKAESFFDERAIAADTARKWGTQHQEIVLEPDDLLEDLEKIVLSLDEPYGGGLPSWYIFKAMKGKTKVALTGIGGDELFGIYGHWRIYNNFFWRMRANLKYMLLDRSPLDTFSMSLKFPQGYAYHRYFTQTMKKKYVFQGSAIENIRPSEALTQAIWDSNKDRDPLDRVTAIHFRTQLPEEFLHMTDKFSMAHSIEARTPLLDHRLVETVMSIPATIRTKPDNLKYLFIEAMKDIISEKVLQSPKKGFILPIDQWLRGPLREQAQDYLGEAYLRKQKIFSPGFHKTIIAPYFKGRRYLKNCVWTAYMFQLWHKQYCLN